MDFSDLLQDFDATHHTERSDNGTDRREDLLKLQQAWINERMSPDILVYESELLDKILSRLKTQVEFVELNSMEIQESDDNDIKVTLMIIESEIERVSFLIRSYLRTRLTKIDRYTMFIMSNVEAIMKLSEEEVGYMHSHLESLTKLYNNLFLKNFDEPLQKLDETGGGPTMVDEPDWDKPVFVRVIGDIEEPIRFSGEDGDELVTLEKNGIFVLKYSIVKDYVSSGEVVLI